MKRPLVALFAATAFVTVAGCAEQPGKKKEDGDGKVETKAVASGGNPDAKPATPPAEAKK